MPFWELGIWLITIAAFVEFLSRTIGKGGK